MPSIVEAWRAGLFRRDNIASNISAGVVVGIVALPLAMAFAIASGAKPEQGLYTALVAGLVVTLLGGSRVQIAGPTGAFAVLLAGVTAKYGFAGLQVITLLAGAILVILGVSKLGAMIRYIPESVVLGFTAGIGIVIWVGQWQNFFGFAAVEGETLWQRLPGLIASLPQLHPTTTAIGVASLAILLLWPKIPHADKVPAPMVVLVAATAFVSAVHPEGVATIGSVFGGVPRGLPPLTMPELSLSDVPALIRPALAIALLGAIESLLSATVADGLVGTKHDPNQELVGQGLANVAASLFGGFAATGAIARTATSVRHGGNSPLAGIVHAITVTLVLLVLAPLAYNIPLASLAAILFVVAYNMSQLPRVIRIARKAPRSDVANMIVTLLLSVFTDISLAVEVGVILALLNFARKMITAVETRPLDSDEVVRRLGDQDVPVPEDVVVYAVDGPFFFGAVEQFEGALQHTGTDPRAIVIKLADVPFIDLTGIVALKDSMDSLMARGVRVAICSASPRIAERLDAAGISGSSECPVTSTLAEAILVLAEKDEPEAHAA